MIMWEGRQQRSGVGTAAGFDGGIDVVISCEGGEGGSNGFDTAAAAAASAGMELDQGRAAVTLA